MARPSEQGLGERESISRGFRVPKALLARWEALVAQSAHDEHGGKPKSSHDVLRDLMTFLTSREWRAIADRSQAGTPPSERKSALGVFYEWMKGKGGGTAAERPAQPVTGAGTPYPMKQLKPEAGPTKRLNIGLKASELAAVAAIAEERDCSPQWWIVSLIRAALTRGVTVGGAELKALADSNYQLMAIGRNLNQIAHHINADPSKHDMLRLAHIEELTKQIDKHRKYVRDLIYACSERWEIQ